MYLPFFAPGGMALTTSEQDFKGRLPTRHKGPPGGNNYNHYQKRLWKWDEAIRHFAHSLPDSWDPWSLVTGTRTITNIHMVEAGFFREDM